MKHRQFTTTLASALCVTGLSGPAAAEDGPVFTGIGDLPGGFFRSSANAVSGDGNTVVGRGVSDAGTEAIRWTWSDGIEGLGDLPGGYYHSQAIGVSEDGSVIVGGSRSAYAESEEGQTLRANEAFRWTEEEGMVGLGDLPDPPFGSVASDVSADGRVIAGTGDWPAVIGDGPGPYAAIPSEAFLWADETGMVGLGDLSAGTIHSHAHGVSADGSVVVGYSGIPSEEAFRWTEEEGMVGLGDLAGAYFFSAAISVSADGDTVVGQSRSEYGPEAFRWTEATGMVGLGDLPGGSFSSVAAGASGDGAVIVGHGTSDLGLEPFVWTEPYGMRRLVDVLHDDFGVDIDAWQLKYAWDVSDDGLVIAGSGINPEGNTEGWVVCLREECFEDDDDDHGGKRHRHHDHDDD